MEAILELKTAAYANPASARPIVSSVEGLWDIATAARELGIGRTTLYVLIADAGFPTVPIGRRRLVDPESARAWWQAREERRAVKCADELAALERARASYQSASPKRRRHGAVAPAAQYATRERLRRLRATR